MCAIKPERKHGKWYNAVCCHFSCWSLTHCCAHNISHNGMLETFFGWTTMTMITVQVFDEDHDEDHDDNHDEDHDDDDHS